MLCEYAVEPACLGDWQTFRYLIEQFGVSQGRLVSQFPKDWPKKVFESCNSFSFRQRKLLELELERIKKFALVRSNRVCQNATWVESAIEQHNSGMPFKAILVKQTSLPDEYILVADEITHVTKHWAVPRERKVHRTVETLGATAAPLLQISDRIHFVDKMFNPYNLSEFPRWRDTLERFIQIATQGRETSLQFEYHCGIENDEFGKPVERRIREFQEICNRQIASILPPGCSITITRWDQHYGGDFFHDRYILTEKGGLRISWGLDKSKREAETTDVTLLDESIWQEYLSIFNHNSTVIRLIDSTIVHSSNSNNNQQC